MVYIYKITGCLFWWLSKSFEMNWWSPHDFISFHDILTTTVSRLSSSCLQTSWSLTFIYASVLLSHVANVHLNNIVMYVYLTLTFLSLGAVIIQGSFLLSNVQSELSLLNAAISVSNCSEVYNYWLCIDWFYLQLEFMLWYFRFFVEVTAECNVYLNKRKCGILSNTLKYLSSTKC